MIELRRRVGSSVEKRDRSRRGRREDTLQRRQKEGSRIWGKKRFTAGVGPSEGNSLPLRESRRK